ncbi:hypothetical protein [Nocardioides sp.]|uniref:hypothetical protein n=1 Tax=Nocardioides sp. TaxID=35761 RepID=UPI003569FCD9
MTLVVSRPERRRTRETEAIAGEASVNLLSDWVLEHLRVRRLRRRLVVAVVALVTLVGLGTITQHLRLYEAHQDLRGEQAVAAGLAQQIEGLAPVRTYVEAVAAQDRTVRETMFGEISFSRVVAGLREATPAGAAIDTMSVTLPPRTPGSVPASAAGAAAGAAGGAAGSEKNPSRGLQATCPGPDPFATKPIVGCLNLSGTAVDRETVGRLVVALGRAGLFVEPFITTTTTSDDQPVAFSGSVGISPKAFSGRYDLPADGTQTP